MNPPEENTPGLTLREAAMRLGIAERTLRKRIQEGKVEAHQVRGKRNHEWRVVLPENGASNGAKPEAPPKMVTVGAEPIPVKDKQAELPATVPADLYREMLDKYEAALDHAYELQVQIERIKAAQSAQAREAPKPGEVVPVQVYKDLLGKYEALLAQVGYLRKEEEQIEAELKARDEERAHMAATNQLLHERLGAAANKVQHMERLLQENQSALDSERNKGVLDKIKRR